MEVIGTVAQISWVFFGVIFIYIGLFLYEDEDNKIKDYFSNVWLKLDDTAYTITEKLNNLISRFTEKLIATVNRYYGPRLISFRALYVSICLSTCSFTVYSGLVGLTPLSGLEKLKQIGWIIILALLLISPVIFYDYRPKLSRIRNYVILFYKFLMMVFALLLSAIGIFAFARELHFWGQYRGAIYLAAAVIFFLMIATDYIYVVICRFVFLKLSGAGNVWSKLFLIAINILFFTLTLFPIFFLMGPANLRWLGSLLIIPLSSLHTILMSILHLIIILFYFVNIIMFELVKRPVYALQKIGILAYRKIFIFLGLFFIGFSSHTLKAILAKII